MNIIKQHYRILTDLSDRAVEKMMWDIEETARTCYRSEDRIDHEAESWKPLIQSLINSGHMTPLEQADIRVEFVVDRGISHELVRHRHISPNQESTRYCNYSKGKFNNEITVVLPVFLYEDYEKYLETGEKSGELDIWMEGRKRDEADYMALLHDGVSPQNARSVLPTCLKTKLIVKTNLRDWRHILELRTDKAAHPDVRALLIPLKEEFAKKMPLIFGDL